MLLALVLSVFIGVSLGLLGGGGSILTLPILVYALHMDAKSAIATSLVVVAATSVAALVPHARGGRVRWRTALVFGAAGMVGAFGGGRLAHFIPSAALLVAFALLMLLTAALMLRGRERSNAPSAPGPEAAPRAGGASSEVPVLKVLAEGVGFGVVTGLLGAGGGFLVVPALVLLGGLSMREAVGTSLVVIGMNSFAGLLGHLGSASIDWRLAAMVSAAAVLGSVGGGLLAGRVPQPKLRVAFAWFVAAMAVFMLGQQLLSRVAAA